MPQDSKAGRIGEQNIAKHTPQGINYLLVIGIDAYVHCPRLYNCVKDAQDLIELLTERYRFEVSNIRTLFNDEATRGNIYRAFREMAQRVTNQDNLLIYFSGHGEYDKIFKQGYWIPVEAQQDNHEQYIPNSEIKTFLSAINSHHTFLMSDSCFSGALFAKGVAKNIEKRYENDPSRWGLTAGRNEIVSDGKPGDNSPFAESILYRLRQNPGSLGVQELCAYVTEYVQAKTNQTPIGEPLKVEGHKNGQFVFHLKKDEHRDWATTKQENSVAAYEHFLLAYPNGIYANDARTAIAFIQEENAWQEAKDKNTIFTYESYLNAFPQGRYRRQAIDAQRDIEEAEAWQRAIRRNAIPAYREFQDNYPNSKYYNDATERIRQLLSKDLITASDEIPTVSKTIKPKPKAVPKPSRTGKPFHYKPYLIGMSAVLLVALFIWIWGNMNDNQNKTNTELQNSEDSTSNLLSIDTPKTIINNPPISEKKEAQTTKTPERSTKQTDNEKRTNTTPTQKEPEKKVQEPPKIDRARVKELLQNAKAYLQAQDSDSINDAIKSLMEAKKLDANNPIIVNALAHINGGDIEGAINVLKNAQ